MYGHGLDCLFVDHAAGEMERQWPVSVLIAEPASSVAIDLFESYLEPALEESE